VKLFYTHVYFQNTSIEANVFQTVAPYCMYKKHVYIFIDGSHFPSHLACRLCISDDSTLQLSYRVSSVWATFRVVFGVHRGPPVHTLDKVYSHFPPIAKCLLHGARCVIFRRAVWCGHLFAARFQIRLGSGCIPSIHTAETTPSRAKSPGYVIALVYVDGGTCSLRSWT
jgi:hypothetical protein